MGKGGSPVTTSHERDRPMTQIPEIHAPLYDALNGRSDEFTVVGEIGTLVVGEEKSRKDVSRGCVKKVLRGCVMDGSMKR